MHVCTYTVNPDGSTGTYTQSQSMGLLQSRSRTLKVFAPGKPLVHYLANVVKSPGLAAG